MSQLNTINHHLGNKKDADNIYLNIRIQNNTNGSSRAVYDVTKDIPLIENASQYYISVIDFTIPITAIPIFQAQVLPPPNTNYTLLQQAIVIVNNGVSSQVNLIMIPSANDLNIPTSYQPTNSYYNIYSFNNLLQAFNIALQTAWVATGSVGPQAPYFYLNPSTQLISLVVSNEFITAGAQIGINSQSRNYLEGIYYIDNYTNPLFLSCKHSFVFYQNNNICNSYGGGIGIPGGIYWFYEQDYPSLDMWSDIRKIFITTTSINIKSLQVPVNLPNGTQTGQIYNAPILFDFTPQFINSASIRTITYYVPESQYRLVDILSDDPIKNINLELFIENTNGVVFPLTVPIYQAVNIKLGFFKKSLYKHYFPISGERSIH